MLKRCKRFLRRKIKLLLIHLLNVFFWFKRETRSLPEDPKKILICNIASFGDVVISTVVLPVLKRRYPKAELGFLLSSQTAEVLQDHPFVSYLHTFDHWYRNWRRGVWRAFIEHVKGRYRVIKEIQKCGYDMAIDLYPVFWMSILPLLSKTKIPIRIGYSIEGYSHLLTHSIPLRALPQYKGKTHLNLLEILGIDVSQDSPFPFCVSKKAPQRGFIQDYIVVHMGTSYALKEWNIQKWSQVIQTLSDQGEKVILTGKGNREQMLCDRVSSTVKCMNYCNQLSWSEFASVVQHAKLLISVDSVAVHLASAVLAPCIVLFAGISCMTTWNPPYPLCQALMKQVRCSPCLNRQGCKSMTCIQEIQPKEILRHAKKLLC